MTNSKSGAVSCHVSGAEKALARAGGSTALCELIESAAKAKAPGVSFSVEVRAVTTYLLAAKIRFPDGRVLPELKMSVSDRYIDRGSIERFATSISEAAAVAGKR